MEHVYHIPQAAGGFRHLPRQEEAGGKDDIAAAPVLAHALLYEESVEEQDGGAGRLL